MAWKALCSMLSGLRVAGEARAVGFPPRTVANARCHKYRFRALLAFFTGHRFQSIPSSPLFNRRRITAVLLIVLAMRALLPTGFMLQAANAADGSFEIVICTSGGTKVVTVDADGAPLPANKHYSDHGLCAFAAAGAAAVVTDGPVALVHAAHYAATTYTLAVALFAETPKPGATSARGPPSSLI